MPATEQGGPDFVTTAINAAQQFAPGHFPIFIWELHGKRTDAFYGFPAIGGPLAGVKVATEQFTQPIDPDEERPAPTQSKADRLYERYVLDRVSGLSRTIVHSVSCLYTMTPDEGFVICEHPEHANVVIVSACSGHGFKHSAAIGESVTQLITQGASTIDLAPFSLQHFINQPSSAGTTPAQPSPH